MENNKFVVSNKTLAVSILCLTNIKFEKFINNEGDTRYSFPRTDEIFKAYTYIQDYRNNKIN